MIRFSKGERAYVSDLNSVAYMNRIAVRNGCKVIERTPNIMGVRVNPGQVFFSQNVFNVIQTDLVISAAHPNLDRIDLVVVNNLGIASVITGTPGAEPHTPDYNPDNFVVLARIFINDLSTSISQSKITDIRSINEGVGTFGKYVENVVSKTNVVVTHNLGDAEPVVVCYDNTNSTIIPGSIIINSNNAITVNFNPSFTGKIVVQGGAGWAGGIVTYPLTVKEQDGIPTILNVNEIRVSNGTLIDNGAGAVSVDTTGVGTITHIHTQLISSMAWNVNHNLGQQVVTVMCYDDTDKWIIPHSIQLINANNLIITFLSATAGKAIIKK